MVYHRVPAMSNSTGVSRLVLYSAWGPMKIERLGPMLLITAGLLAQGSGSKVSMAIPAVNGALEIDVGPTTTETRVRPDGKEVQMRAMNRPDHLLISAFLQKVAFGASPEKCRSEWWPGTEKSSPMKLENVQQTTMNGIARVEYTIPEYKGVAVAQKNLHAYLGAGDLCAEIHMSKLQYTPDDQKLFEDVLTTARLLPDQPAISSTPQAQRQPSKSLGYFQQGSKYYLERNYSVAAQYYQQALDLEKQDRTLSKDFFLVLIDNLGMSYGISGKLAQAKQTFEYGLTQYPEYPLFYYNLACTYGEMSNMSKSLEELRLAYKYKANMIAGETFPDPLQDDSFRNFVANEKFVKAVHEMQQP